MCVCVCTRIIGRFRFSTVSRGHTRNYYYCSAFLFASSPRTRRPKHAALTDRRHRANTHAFTTVQLLPQNTHTHAVRVRAGVRCSPLCFYPRPARRQLPFFTLNDRSFFRSYDDNRRTTVGNGPSKTQRFVTNRFRVSVVF